MCLAGYEPLLDACAVCGVNPPEGPQFHLKAGVLHCARCREQVGEGISMPLSPQTLAAMRHICYGEAKRLLSLNVGGKTLEQLDDVAEAYLHTQLERGFRTLDFYKSLRAGPGIGTALP